MVTSTGEGRSPPELKNNKKAKTMDTATAAKKAFFQAREKDPNVAVALIGVLRDPETDLVTDGGFVFETNVHVAKKQVAEWDLEGVTAKLDKICSDFIGATGIEGTLWKVSFDFPNSKPIARLLTVIVKP